MAVNILTGKSVAAFATTVAVTCLVGVFFCGWGRAESSAPPRLAAHTPDHPPPLWGGLDYGRFAIGFSVILLHDEARTMPGTELPRPILVSLWYPASQSSDEGHLSYRDYVVAAAGETLQKPPSNTEQDGALQAFRELVSSTGVSPEAIDAWLSSPMAAVVDAPHAGGRFPLVVILPGTFHTAYHHAILAEYLASHGYIVAVAPSPSRLDGPPREEEEILPAARQQEEDVRFLVRRLAGDRRVAPGPVGLVGHSFGARAALLIALDVPVAGLVSFDGGIASATGGSWLDGVTFDRRAIRVPILHIYEETDEVIQPDFRLLQSLVSSERLLVRIDGFRHVYFTSLGMVFGLVPGMAIEEMGPSVVEKSRAVAQLTLWFLDRTLHHRGLEEPPSGLLNQKWFSVVRLRPVEGGDE